jgi:translation initiation factor eIF-2B subunit epsilon
VDTEISVCSKDVLNRFTENFDYNDLYDNFINSLQASEITDDRIIAFELDSTCYYARVTDPRTYAAITQDILSRYAHPMVIDSKLLNPKTDYTF